MKTATLETRRGKHWANKRARKVKVDALRLNNELASIIGLLTASQLRTADRLDDLIRRARNLKQAKRMAAATVLLMEGVPVSPEILERPARTSRAKKPKAA